MTKRDARIYLTAIGFKGELDREYFANRKLVREILEEGDVRTINDLIAEIEYRVKTIVDKKYPSNDIYLYFNWLDTQFDGTHEKALKLADKLF